jgi:3-oxoacyl-[acyl-carrier-protein] synthase II
VGPSGRVESALVTKRRVVITGVGAVSALGIGHDANWRGVLEARCGLGRPARFDASAFPCPFAGEIKDFAAKDFVPKSYRKAVKVMARDTEIAVAAAKLAVDDAGFVTRGNEGEPAAALTYPAERLACHIGAGLISADTQELASALVTAQRAASEGGAGNWDTRAWGTIDPADGGPAPMGGMSNLQPLWMLKYLPNMLACHVTIVHGAEGPSNTLTCGEASGLLCIGESARVIERGDADAGFAGSAESKVSLMGLMRLTVMGRLRTATSSDDPATLVRPYAARAPGDAGGTVAGEGGGILMLESMEHAQQRKARMYAEVAGFGNSQSGPPALPPFAGNGAIGSEDSGTVNNGLRRAIEAALRDAGVGAEAIDAIVPQGCGIPAFDAGEEGALKAVFGARLSHVPRVLLVPLTGDCVAGNGGLQAAIGSMMVHSGRVPGDSGGGRCRTVLVCSSSQGGQNAALVLRALA